MERRWTTRVGAEEWDGFVAENRGTVYQSWTWRSILEECKNRPEYLAYREPGGRILAACPLFRVKVGRIRERFMGPPFSQSLGQNQNRPERQKLQWVEPLPTIIAADVDPGEIVVSLQGYLRGTVPRFVDSVELSNLQPAAIESLTGLGLERRRGAGNYLTNLERVPTTRIWSDFFDKHDRQSVKFFGVGAEFQMSSSDESFTQFYQLHKDSMTREGYSPVSEEFLGIVRKQLGDRLKVAPLQKSGELVASQLLILDRDTRTVYVDKLAYSRSKNIHSSVVAIWYQVCKWAEDNGFHRVNFGGARTAEAHRIKRKFGGDYSDEWMFVIPNTARFNSTATNLMRTAKKLGGVFKERRPDTSQREVGNVN